MKLVKTFSHQVLLHLAGVVTSVQAGKVHVLYLNVGDVSTCKCYPV